jgi:hypothetical protein
LPGIYFGDAKCEMKVVFYKDCMYTKESIKDTDGDINKLIGHSFGIFPSFKNGKFVPAHHKNSYRIGWNANDNRGVINLYNYHYNNGMRFISPICDVGIDTVVTISYQRTGDIIETFVSNMGQEFGSSVRVKGANYGYLLGPYFGGNAPAPHDMSITIKR